MLLSGCGEERSQDTAGAPAEIVARREEGALPVWLTPENATDPARWLAGRAAGRPLAANDPAVSAVRHALAEAAPRFIEDSRMIANRTAQVAEILREVPAPERLLADLTATAGADRRRRLYGALCQHYVNLRTAGAGHQDALAGLRPGAAAPDLSDRESPR